MRMEGGNKPSFYIKICGIFAGGELNHAPWLVGTWCLNHASWLVRAESWVLIGQELMVNSEWNWVNWTVTCDWSELDDWIPQVGRLEAEYHKLAGLRSVEYHKLAGWGLSTTSWPVWGLLSATSWPVEVWVPQVGQLKMNM
jgi:hypothetical protein